MQILQILYILILNPFYKYMGVHLSDIRDKVIFFICLLLAFYFPIYYSGWLPDILKTETSRCILGSILIGMLILVSIDRPLKTVKWNKWFCTVYFLCGLSILIAGCIHPIGNGFRPFSLIMLVGFPCLYLVWNNRKDYEILYDHLSKAVAIMGVIYFSLCILLSFMGQGFVEGVRYQGTITNPNRLGMVAVTVAFASLYLIIRGGKSLYLYMITAGMGTTLILFCEARTSLLALFLIVVVWMLFYYRNIVIEHVCNNKNTLVVTTGIVVVLVIILGYGLMEWGNQFSTFISSYATDTINRFSFAGKDLNTFSSGRIEIWKRYFADLNWIGHNYNTIDLDVALGPGIENAHNNPLDFAHRCGIPTGILYLLMEFLAGIYILKVLFSKRARSHGHLFCVLSISAFLVFSMLEVETLPFKRDICFYFFMALAPVFVEKGDSKKSL